MKYHFDERFDLVPTKNDPNKPVYNHVNRDWFFSRMIPSFIFLVIKLYQLIILQVDVSLAF